MFRRIASEETTIVGPQATEAIWEGMRAEADQPALTRGDATLMPNSLSLFNIFVFFSW
jgi:hypothetical protein